MGGLSFYPEMVTSIAVPRLDVCRLHLTNKNELSPNTKNERAHGAHTSLGVGQDLTDGANLISSSGVRKEREDVDDLQVCVTCFGIYLGRLVGFILL